MNNDPVSSDPAEPDAYSVTAVLKLHDEAEAGGSVSLPDIWVQGEIERLNRDKDHVFFRIRDERSQMHAVVFKYNLGCLPSTLQEGVEARVRGTVKRYAGGAYRQIEVRQVRILGDTSRWRAAGEAVEARLAGEGLRLPSARRPIPRFPRAVGVVTAPSSAAWRDILAVIEERAPWIEVILSPASTQGEGASGSVTAAVHRFAQHHCDVVILARGGGSSSDLACFDTEIVARAVVESPVPMITAIGHAPDLSLADRVADRACITPSMAAVEVTPESRDALLHSVQVYALCLERSVRRALHDVKERLREAELSLTRLGAVYAEQGRASDRFFSIYLTPPWQPLLGATTSPTRSNEPMRTSVPPLHPFPPLEMSLHRLEQIVRRLQAEASPLDEHLALVQDGFAHVYALRQTIQAAALTVDHLVTSAEGLVVRERMNHRSWPPDQPR
ncbi:MAG: exodeoxyribonuclease VII large subunit [Gemmatimonadota bacterium]|nr:exodeoxyribonuclease VII large subunit [Gemmatimonadota bacterium]